MKRGCNLIVVGLLAAGSIAAGADAGLQKGCSAMEQRKAEKKIEFLEPDFYAENVKIRIPVMRVTGAKPGPTAVITANQHGREINGMGGLHLLYQELDPEIMSGTAIIIPSMNPVALQMRQQDFPGEAYRLLSGFSKYNFHNMNRKWFEDKNGTAPGALTQKVYDTYCKDAAGVLDFHCWRGVTCAMATRRNREALLALGMRRNLFENGKSSVCLTDRAEKEGKVSVLIEFEGQTSLTGKSVQEALRAGRNFLRYMKILPGELELPKEQFIEKSDTAIFVETPVRGVVIPLYDDCTVVPAGAEYMQIVSPETGEKLWSYKTEKEMMNIYSARYFFGEGIEPTSVVEPGMVIGHIEEVEYIRK